MTDTPHLPSPNNMPPDGASRFERVQDLPFVRDGLPTPDTFPQPGPETEFTRTYRPVTGQYVVRATSNDMEAEYGDPGQDKDPESQRAVEPLGSVAATNSVDHVDTSEDGEPKRRTASSSTETPDDEPRTDSGGNVPPRDGDGPTPPPRGDEFDGPDTGDGDNWIGRVVDAEIDDPELEGSTIAGDQPPGKPPVDAGDPPAERPDDEPKPFLPFRQQFDGNQEPPPPEEQRTVAGLFDELITNGLPGREINRIYEGRHIEVEVSVYRGRDFENKTITILERVAEGENRGWVNHPNLVKYELSEGVVRRADPLPERSQVDPLVTSDPDDTPLVSAIKEGAFSVFSQMDDLQGLGVWNQPIGEEEMRAVIEYIKDVQEHGEPKGAVTWEMRK